MGLVGLGRAFNLRFMPNGPLRTNCYHRQMPRMGIFGGGNMSITENINIQNGPSGFWGFMSGLFGGLFGGGMYGMGMCGMGMGGGLFGMLNARQAVAPQGTEQNQTGEDAHLKNLIQAYGKKFEIVSHPDKQGIFQAFPKDGGKPIEGTYQELCEKLADENSDNNLKVAKDPENAEAELNAESANGKGLELIDGKKPVEQEDPLDQKVGQKQTSKKPQRARGTGGSERVDEGQTHDMKKVPIHWNIRRHAFHRFSGEAVIQFTDNEGKQRFFKAEKNGWHSYVGTEAGFKAELANDLQRQLDEAGLADKFTI